MMKQTFMRLNLSCRLFLIIIILFPAPYLSLFPWTYRKVEIIIHIKAQSLEKENLSRTRDDIKDLYLSIVKAPDYLISLGHYGVLYRESEQEGYIYLKCRQYVDEWAQNVNNALSNSSADTNVLSKDRLLYSALSYQEFRYQDFSKEQIVSTTYFSNAHRSYRNFENDQIFISYIRELPPFCSQSYYLVISIPANNFLKPLGTATGTMELTDSAGNIICGVRLPQNNESLREETSIFLSGWKLEDIIFADFLYRDIYQLRLLIFAVSSVLLMAHPLVTFSATYAQLRPLLKLKKQMELVMSGNLNTEMVTIDPRDEIGSPSRIFNNMVNEISHLTDEIRVIQKRESELCFEVLLAQTGPHFLFNISNSIKWMPVVSGTDHVTATITSFGCLLEISMDRVNGVLPLGEGLENMRSYTQIQQVQYLGRLDVFYHIGDFFLDCCILKLILQPLVESSILHNTKRRDHLSIDVSGKLSENFIILCAKDSGTGMTKERMEQILKSKTRIEKGYIFSGLGVCSVEERTRFTYGPDYGLEYNSDGYSHAEAAATFPRYQKSDPLLQKEAKQ